MTIGPVYAEIPLSVGVIILAAGIIVGAFMYALTHRRYVDFSAGPGRVVSTLTVAIAIIGAAWSIANLA